MIRPLPRLAALALVAFLAPLATALAPAHAASADSAMLQSYVGSYTGAGTISGNPPQRLNCRLSMQSGGADKIDYTGRCSGGGVGFSMTGLISSAGGKLVASMSGSGGGMSGSGSVAGSRHGNGAVFASKTHDTAMGHDRSISSSFALVGGGIRLEFSMVDNSTHKTTSGSIAFTKA
jgi:hypothetical protein